MTGRFSPTLDYDLRSIRVLSACFVVGTLVGWSIIGKLYGWDPTVNSTAVRVRWVVTGLLSMAVAYDWGDAFRGGKRDDPEPYKLSGWSHIHGGSKKASRHIVEYGLGQGVRTEGNVEGEYNTIWRG